MDILLTMRFFEYIKYVVELWTLYTTRARNSQASFHRLKETHNLASTESYHLIDVCDFLSESISISLFCPPTHDQHMDGG